MILNVMLAISARAQQNETVMMGASNIAYGWRKNDVNFSRAIILWNNILIHCHHRGLAIPTDMHHGTCVSHVPWCMLGKLTSGFLWSRWRGTRSRHSRRMRNPQFYVSGKTHIDCQGTDHIRPDGLAPVSLPVDSHPQATGYSFYFQKKWFSCFLLPFMWIWYFVICRMECIFY